jgi:hypothetical protein
MTDSTEVAPPKCPYCGEDHNYLRCLRLKAIEFYETGDIRRIELVNLSDFASTDAAPPPTPGIYPKLKAIKE